MCPVVTDLFNLRKLRTQRENTKQSYQHAAQLKQELSGLFYLRLVGYRLAGFIFHLEAPLQM